MILISKVTVRGNSHFHFGTHVWETSVNPASYQSGDIFVLWALGKLGTYPNV